MYRRKQRSPRRPTAHDSACCRLRFSCVVLGALLLVFLWSVVTFVLVQIHHHDVSEFTKDAGGFEDGSQQGSGSLAQAHRRIAELENQVQRLQGSSQNQGDKCQSEPGGTSILLPAISDSESYTTPFASNPVCQLLAASNKQQIPNPLALWTRHLANIHKATQLPNDHKYLLHDFAAQLLHLVSPRLPHSIKTVPHDWRSVEGVLQVAATRYQYLQQPSPQNPPPRPVKIVVLGGSLLVGMNCRKILADMNWQIRMPLGECSWANRLEKFINQVVLGTKLSMNRTADVVRNSMLVEVTKVALGGTNTGTGTVILDYDLIPHEAKNPDIIINAYSTNDMHIVTMLEAQSGNTTLRDKVFEMTQEFVRRVMMQRQQTEPTDDRCDSNIINNPPPLLLHVDDYLGNEQREIWATTELSQGVQVLANYYGFASASYADVVRDFVYGDTHEFWFSPEGWYDPSTKEFTREIHPNMGMHVVSAWIVAYNLLNMVTTYCTLEPWKPSQTNSVLDYEHGTYLTNLPKLTGDPLPPGKPERPPLGLRPLLTKQLSLEDVTRMWKEHSKNQVDEAQQRVAAECQNGNGIAKDIVKCPFSWLSGISLEHNKQSLVEEFFQTHTSFSGDWSFASDHKKLGIVPKSLNSRLTVELQRVPQTIRRVTLFYMKSYGDRWADSTVQIQISSRSEAMAEWNDVISTAVVGFHNKHTSETYTEEMGLRSRPVAVGSTLRIEFTLVKGGTFKIMGLAICS